MARIDRYFYKGKLTTLDFGFEQGPDNRAMKEEYIDLFKQAAKDLEEEFKIKK